MRSFITNMKISAVNINNFVHFKGEAVHFSAYDDSVSQARREYIRAHYDSWHLPHQSIYEREGRMDEYNVKKLIASLTEKHYTHSTLQEPSTTNDGLNYKLLDSLIIWNNKPIANTNSYRGSNLVEDLENLNIAKKAGIKRVVDLEGYPNLTDACKKEGIEYFNFSIIDKFWMSHACKDKETIVNRAIHFWRDIQGANDNSTKDNIKKDIKRWNKNKNDFIDMFVKFIQIMQQDNVYIGCMLGTERTDNALMLNHFFNPKASNTPNCVTIANRGVLDKLEILYRNLSDANKESLGWTKKFEAEFMPRLKRAIKDSKYMII